MSDDDMDADWDFEEELDYDGGDASAFDAPRVAPQWRFLRDFIELVADRYVPQMVHRLHTDTVRVGRDSDDWWINVQYENGALVSKYDELADDRTRRYRTVRDATLLLGVVERVDHDAFLALLIRRGKFDVSKFMDLDNHALPVKFNFFFCIDLTPSEYAWTTLSDVFGDQHYTDDVLAHLQAIDKIAQTIVKPTNTIWRHKLYAPLTIKFTFRPTATELTDQVAILKNITKLLVHVQHVEAKRAQSAHLDSQTGAVVPPVFHLDHIDLDLREFSCHADVLKALEELVATGIRISSLTLPQYFEEESTGDASVLLLAWASFVIVALGVRPLPSKRVVAIDHVVLPPNYTNDHFMAPFLSALRYTKVLKSLRIEADTHVDENDNLQRRLWSGLGFALFNPSSSHCVESLDLCGHQLTDDALNEFSRLLTATDPTIEWLMSRTGETSDEPSTRINYPRGIVQQGARVMVFTSGSPFGLFLPTSFMGEVLPTDADESEVFVLIPGIGFVMVDRTHVLFVPGSRTRTVRPRHVTKLRFNTKASPHNPGEVGTTFVTHPFLPRLLAMIGRSLTSLGVDADDIDDDSVQSILTHCPHLDSLLIDSTAVASLTHLLESYEQRTGAHPSSINLRSVSVPVEAIDAFLERLGSEAHPMYQKLRRLAIGQDWTQPFGETTAYRLDAMLHSNDRLSHLYVHADRELAWHPEEYEYHGEEIPAALLPRSSRLAFLSVLTHHLKCGDSSTSTAACGLTEEALRLVFDFAGEPTAYLVVVHEPNYRLSHWDKEF